MILQTGEVFSTKENEFVLKIDLSLKILTVTILTVKDDSIYELSVERIQNDLRPIMLSYCHFFHLYR